ncbi:MAG: PAS domain S-box protein, partial [Bacteroidia bacterium]|nr:PAS domain S-box protein [Bacteroidia bacterium]
MLTKYWEFISNLGIDSTINRDNIKRLKLTNQLILISIILTILYIFIYAYFELNKILMIEIVAALFYTSLLFFSFFKHYRVARFLFVVALNFQIYFLALSLGTESQVQLLFIPISAVPVVLFRLKNYRSIIFLIGLSIGLLISLYIFNQSAYFFVKIDYEMLLKLRLVFLITSMLCEVIVIYSIVKNYETSEHRLGRSNELLHYQFQSMFDNSLDALFLVDWKLRKIIKANKRAVELFEMEKESDFFERYGLDFHKNEFSTKELDKMRSELMDKGIYENEILYRTNLGREFWGALAIRLIYIGGLPFQSVRVTDISERKKAEQYTKTALQEKEILLAEIHHRVKNNMAVISGLIGLQSNYVEDEKAKELFEESRNRIHSMALIHDKLYQHETFAKIEFCAYINDLVDHIKGSYNATEADVSFSITCNDIFLNIQQAVPCGLVLNELISNSFKHAFKGRKEGEIKIVCTKMGEKFTMMVSDNGVGYDADKALKESNSLGLTLINALIEQINGT